ncbi:MAG: Zn-dependent hydrolase [Candidatus Saccharibacteria bacterium]|nr:Zn-dependent hydrolase [Candidatus Saccharibacteria bacterium]
MDLQFFGANCISISFKNIRVVVDDNLAALGAKSITKPDDISLFTGPHAGAPEGRLMFDMPGEYEVSDVSIVGIPAHAHIDEAGENATMYKIIIGDLSILIAGHVHPDSINDKMLERIGLVDVLFVPVGGSGFTLDSGGALKFIKEIEPKLVIPTHYASSGLHYEVPQADLESALKDMAMEPKERIAKLKLKPTELSEGTQLIVLERS